MRSVLAFCVFTCVSLCLLFGRMSSSEPFVSLTFYGPHILKVNVKEYVLLGDSDVIVGCSILDLPLVEISGILYLYQNDTLLKKVVISDDNVQLIWSGPIFSFASFFCCEVNLTTNNIVTNIKGSEVKLQRYSENTVTDMCLPEGGGFLLNEVILIVCLSSRRGAKWISDEDDFLGENYYREIAKTFHVTTNNILLKLDSINADCQRGGSSGGVLCSLPVQPFPDGLNIYILPDTFDESIGFDRIVFECYTKLPTDRISWRLDSTNGNILDFDYGEESKINFTITHSFFTSQLMVETEVENVVSVSCKTSRSGYVTVATAYNVDALRNIPTSTSVSTPNTTSQTSHFIIIIVILGFSLIFVIFYLIFQKLWHSQEKVLGDNLAVKPTIIDTQPNDNPYYYATSYDAQNSEIQNDVNKEGTNLEKRLVQVTRTETVDHLTTDVLGDGAVVTFNEAYQIT
ncbi:hypothetical protein HOLleu_38854 [Holothuria leucospilota]|uniref:Ig-like domain-containing protein n=1 Tax=Holothuria leucospilota TaxID=206669 RepID=A0A9Q1BDW7_HOLLE|nr:hypothetical protein HOLleu_38854 [Holothuria leucospilota]